MDKIDEEINIITSYDFCMININNSIAQEKTDAPTEIGSKKNVSLNSFPAVLTEYHADLVLNYGWGKPSWANELYIISDFLSSERKATKITIDGNKEAGLVALFSGPLEKDKIDRIVLRNVPFSYMAV